MTALLAHYGYWVHLPRQRAQGPAPKPRWTPLPHLLYAQVVKRYRRRRLVGVRHRIVFGTLKAVQRRLAAHGWQINTAFIERQNLTIRQHVAAVGRRVMTLCTGEAGLGQQLALYHGYYDFCLPHASLRQPLPEPLPTNGSGSAKTWGRERRRWPRGSLTTSGRCGRYCGSACLPGRSHSCGERQVCIVIVGLSGPGVPAGKTRGLHKVR